jgi:hypothetical protein
VIPAPPCPDGDDAGEKREHTIPLKDGEEDELSDTSGYGQAVEQGLERQPTAERIVAPSAIEPRQWLRPWASYRRVCFCQAGSASRWRFDPIGKPGLEPVSSLSSHIMQALDEPRRPVLR